MRINLLLPVMTLLITGSGWASSVFDMEPDWTYQISGNPTNLRIKTACLNGDAIPDLIVGNILYDKLSIFYGNGDGSFYLGEEYLGYQPLWIESADVDNDGDNDVLIRFPEILPDSVAVYLNAGNGQFQDPICSQSQISTFVDKFVICDLNADSYLDIVTANENGPVYVMLGNGTGYFNVQEIYNDAGGVLLGFNCADIDSDNDIDIVLICNGKLSVLLNNGDGSVTWNGYYGGFSNEGFFGSLGIGNLDSDNFPDIASTPGATMGEYSILSFIGDGSGAFSQIGSGWLNWGFSMTQTEINDFNLDGYNDAVFTGYDGNLLMLGDGTGSLDIDYFNFSDSRCHQAAVTDLDLDGDIDYVTASRPTPSTFQIETFLNKTIQSGIEDENSGSLDTSFWMELTENPVSLNSDIDFSLPASSNSSLNVYDIHGRRLAEIQEGYISAGDHSVSWNTADLPAGCYTLVLQTDLGSSYCRCVKID